ncbi:sulfatase-like hydrolase/transferase [Lachnospira pectinoschiza]|uniref:Arylsulfatase A n=1 Tax=Lachnospira pectinoschiza TaxID=28052 RepID=A0A1G9ZI63_9FIRM|nr:sulfatase-like hydrolase/transferase [Lachnospira pectinoschiza]SDN21048.1 Arylsulfatase A [Lachnospira pectinoschiza]
MPKKKTNIIIINPDEMRFDTMGHMGNPAAKTPALDNFANNEAVSFKNCYVQNPVCVPSRCSFFTGLYPHVNGHRTMSHLLQPHETSMFKELMNQGYYVWMNARNDLVATEYEGLVESHADEIFYGFKDERRNSFTRGKLDNPIEKEEEIKKFRNSFYEGKTDGAMDRDWEDMEGAIDRIKHMKELDKPLCLFLGLMNPHPEYRCEEPWYSSIDREKVPTRIKAEECTNKSFIEEKIREYQNLGDYSEESWNELRATYLAQCSKVDEIFKRVCEALKEVGEYDNSAIFFFSDHGDFTGDYGLSEKAQNTFEDCLTKVPMLIKPPKDFGKIDPGVTDSLIELVDFYATAMDFANAESEHDHFGKTIRPILENRENKIRDLAFCEGGRMAYEDHCDEYHIAGPNGPNKNGLYWPKQKAQSNSKAHAKGTMVTDGHYKYVHRSEGLCELYDLYKDKGERYNLIDNPEYKEIVIDLKMKMLDWYQETCDIVPRKYDSRVTAESIIRMVGGQISKEKEDEIRKLIGKGSPMSSVLAVAKS